MKIMAVDFGDARTGLAMCDRTEFLASPIGVIKSDSFGETLKQTAAAAEEYGAQMIVVGYPKNMDGSEGDRAKKCRKFSKMLKEIIPSGIEVVLWDERATTILAHNYLNETNTRGQKRKNVVDEVAATIILESYLAYRKNQKQSSES